MPAWRLPRFTDLDWAVGWAECFQDRLPDMPTAGMARGEDAEPPPDLSPEEAAARAELPPLAPGLAYVVDSKCRGRGCSKCHRVKVGGRPWGFITQDEDWAQIRRHEGVYFAPDGLAELRRCKHDFYDLFRTSWDVAQLQEEASEASGAPVSANEVLDKAWTAMVRYVSQAVDQGREP